MQIKISVVIPTWQRPQLLTHCLQALLKQTFEPTAYEIIVVTDGPDALTREMVTALSSPGIAMQCLELDQKRGPAAARNLGWLKARGQIITFTDDDCLPDKDWLLEISRHIDADGLQAATGRIQVPRPSRPTDHEQNTAGLETAEFVTANCACTKKALITVGGFDERFTAAWREDSDLEFKFLQQGIAIMHLERALVVHPVRAAKWGSSIRDQRKTFFNALLYKKNPALYRKKIQPLPPVLYYFIVSAAILALVGAFVGNNDVFKSSMLCWLLLTLYFMVKRLYQKSLKPSHLAEMIYTSTIIPFASLYWHWRGALAYKVWFF